MNTAGQFITALRTEQKVGNVSAETEQHLKHEFRRLGKDAPDMILAAAVEAGDQSSGTTGGDTSAASGDPSGRRVERQIGLDGHRIAGPFDSRARPCSRLVRCAPGRCRGCERRPPTRITEPSSRWFGSGCLVKAGARRPKKSADIGSALQSVEAVPSRCVPNSPG
jgi:hypothetical protein